MDTLEPGQLLAQCRAARERLVARDSNVARRFVEVDIPEWGVTLPFLPIGCFREFQIFGAEQPAVTFRSSGSTQSVRARHMFSEDALRTYSRAATAGFRAFCERFGIGPDRCVLSLIPPPAVWPESSLAAMIGMFAAEGERVIWCDHESFFDVLGEESKVPGRSVVVFGTSFHHIHLARHGRRAPATSRLFVIDTGGTKGRVEAFSSDDMAGLLQNLYGRDAVLLSEYGMCELASQAWSRVSPHDQTFVCNPGLVPFALDFTPGRAPRTVQQGFLGFVDSANVDSYPAILTEDLAEVGPLGSGTFRLLGRAPDATLKGCSLHVRDHFVFSEGGDVEFPPAAGGVARLDEDFPQRLCARLKDFSEWDAWSVADLSRSLADWTTLSPAPPCERTLHVVASANIPITWLFPTLVASAAGFRSVTVQLPSLRLDDPLAVLVRRQIVTLAEALRPELGGTSLRLQHDARLPSGGGPQDLVVVFGSDDTCTSFARALASSQRKLLTFGSLHNSLAWPLDESEILAACTAWCGRGCLTPIAVVVPEHDNVGNLGERLCAALEERLAARMGELPHLHVHDALALAALFGDDSGSRLWRGAHALVADLRGVAWDIGETLQRGGMGQLCLISTAQAAALPWLQRDSWKPKMADPHMGRPWSHWILGERGENH